AHPGAPASLGLRASSRRRSTRLCAGKPGLWRKAEPPGVRRRRLVGPEGSCPHLGALLLGYYADDGKLVYAGRVGTGMSVKVLADLRRRLDPVARKTSPL